MGLKRNPKIMAKKIFIKTFGCQMNEYDSNRIYDTVQKIGFEKTDEYEKANCYVLNTCHIRDKAKEKVYHEIGRVKKIFRNKKKPIVIVAGCVAQAENQEMLRREPYIDIVMGPQSYHKINEVILNFQKKLKKEEETEFDTISKFNYLSKIKNKNSKVSSFLTIQEGCDKFCNFCVVPYTRGPEYSRPFKQIIKEVEELVGQGTREIILLGQNVNAYNYKEGNKEFRLSDLLLELERQNRKTLLIGVSFALLDFVEKHPVKLQNTIVMETGGMKGKREEMVREQLHSILCKHFNVPKIHSEYGMTELLSQAYSKGNGIFYCPPWMRVSCRDTNDPLSNNKKSGGINIIDLANVNSCSFIASQDLGKINENNTFEILGRFDASDIRGCNLMVV